MIHYISPYRSDKDIGKAYNEALEKIDGAGDWVCITDYDVLFLTPNSKKLVEEAVQSAPKDVGLIGCYTNRIKSREQQHNGEFSDNHDIRYHLEIAEQREKTFGSELEPCFGVAGFFMLFRYDFWKEHKFMEGVIHADTKFNEKILSYGYKRMLIKGLYLYHCYRIKEKGIKKAHNSVDHLKPTT